MKINTIYHSEQEMNKERKKDLSHCKFSKNPVHHPFLKERELIRAINNSKLERLMAKPFITALSFHREGIINLVKHSVKHTLLTSSFDNNIIYTNLETRECILNLEVNQNVKGIGIDLNENIYIGQNNSCKRLNDDYIFKCKSNVNNICVGDELYVTTYKALEIFDIEKGVSKMSIDLKNTNVIGINPSFTHLLGVASIDNNYIIDKRCNKAVYSFTHSNKTNAISFCPTDGFYIATGNENGNGYINDLRYIDTPVNVLRGHVSAVTCIKYHPNGKEICTGSFDQTIRIFRANERKSRDIYYNQRMHNINGIEYSNDGQFIISGSDDGSIRIWKSEASKNLGALSRKEKESLASSKILIDKYKEFNEVERITKHRFIPKLLKSKMKQKHEHYEAEVRKGHIKKGSKE